MDPTTHACPQWGDLANGGAMADHATPTVRQWQRDAADDPDAFWGKAAAALPWFKAWDTVFE